MTWAEEVEEVKYVACYDAEHYVVTRSRRRAERALSYASLGRFTAYARYHGTVVVHPARFRGSKKAWKSKYEILEEIGRHIGRKVYEVDEFAEKLSLLRGKYHEGVDRWLRELEEKVRTVKVVRERRRSGGGSRPRPAPVYVINPLGFLRRGRWGVYYNPRPQFMVEEEDWLTTGDMRFIAVFRRRLWLCGRFNPDRLVAEVVSVDVDALVRNPAAVAAEIARLGASWMVVETAPLVGRLAEEGCDEKLVDSLKRLVLLVSILFDEKRG